MAELAAVGVAASILQVIDFGIRFVATTWQVSQSEHAFLTSLNELQNSSERFRHAQNDLQSTRPGSNTAINSLVQKSVTISQEMTDTLDKIRRGRNSLMKAWSALWKEERLKVLEVKLREVQSDLAFYMTIDLRSAIRDSAEKQDQILRELRDAKSLNGKSSQQDLGEEAAGSNDSRLGYGGTVIKHLTDGLQLHDKIKSELISDLIANVYGPEEKDLSLSDASHIQLSDERKSKLEQLFISRLCYDTMLERVLTIKDAHEGTFRWIFEKNDTTGFKSWLVSDEPLYWITGKPGSGKSTLMRYLLQPISESEGNNRTLVAASASPESIAHPHGRCATYLKQWAGTEHELTVVSFHFWAVGSELQSSQEGLFRTLLVQLLRAHPEVIPMVAPLRWESLCLFNIDPRNFNQVELGDMFQKAIVHISTRAKLAIFIDGLDEFEGDCFALISLVRSCLVSSVKICVSSRHWNEFEDAFGDCPGLQMQDLTYQDISKYVSSKFEADIQFRSLQRRQPHVAKELLEAIVKKSSGVFLWVTIVVASLLTGIGAGDRVEDLHMRLGRLPAEIEDLYERILENVDSGYREHTTQLLQLMLAFKTPPSALLFWYADEVNFMDRAIKEDTQAVSLQEALDRVEDIRRRLNSRCKGLLEIREITASSSHSCDSRFGGHVDYLHKTVYEYISRDRTQQRLQKYLRTSYDASLRIAAAYATLTKGTLHQCAMGHLGNRKVKESRSSNLVWCLGYAANASHESRNEVVRLLDHLTGVCRDIPEDMYFSGADTKPYIIKDSPATLRAGSSFGLDYLCGLDSRQKMLCLASWMSVVEYVKARARPGGLITIQPSTLDMSRNGLTNLIERAFDKWSGNRGVSLLSLVCLSHPNGASILKYLLEKGAKPNMKLALMNRTSKNIQLTPWEEILAKALIYCVVHQEENENKDNVLRCVRQMVDGGAKVDLKTVKTARKEAMVTLNLDKPEAKVRIDKEEVYQCLKKMKVHPDAQFEVSFGGYLSDNI
ncbi:vegetative incompatibility protein het-e-1 [Fusarium flagelliforme]|uniref:Vegetative incompatibility protein het-e-1 n=1 Tax=Fusarium flagelliforme TaxID=2675880 RepID=A0A395MVL0_9HYPO|nr:vegetative incompatibility protein het-e-1 [Fusarium flagelliforme]